MFKRMVCVCDSSTQSTGTKFIILIAYVAHVLFIYVPLEKQSI